MHTTRKRIACGRNEINGIESGNLANGARYWIGMSVIGITNT